MPVGKGGETSRRKVLTEAEFLKRQQLEPLEALDYMNANYFCCLDNNGFRAYREDRTESGIVTLTSFRYSELQASLSNKFAGDVPLGKFWKENKNRRDYKGIVFNPSLDFVSEPNGYYNLFSGLSVTPEPGDWSLFRTFLLDCVCNKDLTNFNYLLAWLAQAYRHPETKPGVALVFLGKKGTGKSFAAAMISHPYEPYTHFEDRGFEGLTEKFNGETEDKLMFTVNEGSWEGDHKQAELVLRSFITDKTRKIENKFGKKKPVANYARLLITSEEGRAIPSGPNERRYWVVRLTDEYKEREAEGEHIFKAIESQMLVGGFAAMLYDLQLIEYTDAFVSQAPSTTELYQQTIGNFSPELQWLHNSLQWGRIGNFEFGRDINTDTVYENYADSISARQKYTTLTRTTFGQFLFRIFPRTELKKGRMDSPKTKGVTSNKARPVTYRFPSLERSREIFSKELGIPVRDLFHSEDEKEASELESNSDDKVYIAAPLPFKTREGDGQ